MIQTQLNIPLPSGMLFSYLATSLFVAFIVVVFFQLVGRKTTFKSKSGLGPKSSSYLALLVVVLSFLGSAVGFTGGWSRVGVVGDVVPAALALVGGFTAYLFSVGSSKALVALVSTSAFTLAFFVSYLVGAETRNPSERFDAYKTFCHKALSNPDLLKDDKSYCRFLQGAGDMCMVTLFEDAKTFSALREIRGEDLDNAWSLYSKNFIDRQNKVCRGQ
ncbi:hypothetical protein IWQ54_001122 [Labrenzia sp. EL_195]|nr:hypothetical protein [Labrenzia sp. EL_195]